MEEQIKNIISKYIKIPAAEINPSTVIDRTAVAGSIVLHRMYAALATEGFAVDNYADIKNFAMLMQRFDGQIIAPQINSDGSGIKIVPFDPYPGIDFLGGIGIDIEEIKNLPVVNDFREDEFYKMNFTPEEIAYCILQPNVIASFTGLFAAKEAIVKADNQYKSHLFNKIFIDHLPDGKPVFKDFQLSVSHSKETAVAIALKTTAGSLPTDNQLKNGTLPSSKNNFSTAFFIALIAIILSLVSIFLLMYKN